MAPAPALPPPPQTTLSSTPLRPTHSLAEAKVEALSKETLLIMPPLRPFGSLQQASAHFFAKFGQRCFSFYAANSDILHLSIQKGQ